MNRKYWTKFYKNFDVKKPSSFAPFCLYYLKKYGCVLDVGCGNGRDTYFFSKNKIDSIGIDFANLPKKKPKAKFLQKDFKDFDFGFMPVYARFFIHTISYTEMLDFFVKCQSLVMVEFRNLGDKPVIYQKHERRFVDGLETMELLKTMGFEIIHFQLSQGLAKYKNEDPLICRIIARRKK